MSDEYSQFGIIMVALNSEKTIRDALNSVIKQLKKKIICVVVDGGSIDKTREIVESYADERLHFISYPGSSIYEAMNCGIKYLAHKTHIIGFLNTDDFLYSERTLENIDLMFQNDADIVIGDVLIVDKQDLKKIKRLFKGFIPNKISLFLGIMPPHPGFYVRTHYLIHSNLSEFNSTIPVAADIVWMRKLLKRTLAIKYTGEVSVVMRDGGVSDKGFLSKLNQNMTYMRFLFGAFWYVLFIPMGIIKIIRYKKQKLRASYSLVSAETWWRTKNKRG